MPAQLSMPPILVRMLLGFCATGHCDLRLLFALPSDKNDLIQRGDSKSETNRLLRHLMSVPTGDRKHDTSLPASRAGCIAIPTRTAIVYCGIFIP